MQLARYIPDIGFIVPLEEREEFAALKADVRRKAELMLTCMTRVMRAKNRKAAYVQLAADCAGMNGFSAVSIKRTWRAFHAAGYDWRACVANYHRADKKAERELDRKALPKIFINEWKRRSENNQRASKPAYRALVRDWKAGVSIPGYGTWREWYAVEFPGRALPDLCRRIPRGWSYTNLIRHLASDAVITVMRDGFFAAHSQLPQICRDRSELRSLELVCFDDFQTDFRVTRPDLAQVCKMVGLAAQDVGSAFVIEHGVGAATKDDDDHRKGLARADMRLLAHTILRKYGVPTDWIMHWLVENNVATFSPEDRIFLQRLSKNLRVHNTAMTRREALPAGWGERFGSPWAKGWLESLFNLFHNEAAALPGQFGLNQLHGKTGAIDAKMSEALALFEAVQHLPVDVRTRLRTGLLTEEDARVAVRDIFQRINSREEHRLQGFQKIAHWRLTEDDPWRALSECPPAIRDHVKIGHLLERPVERFARLALGTKFQRVSEVALMPLLNDKARVTVTRPYQIAFRWRDEKRTFHFQDERLRKEGTPFIAHFNPRDFNCIHLYSEAGEYVCTMPLFDLAPVLDAEAIRRAQATAKAAQNHLLAQSQAVHAEDAKRRVDDTEHNNAVIAEATMRLRDGADPIGEAEIAAAAAQAAQTAINAGARKQTRREAKKRDDINSQLAELSRSAGKQE